MWAPNFWLPYPRSAIRLLDFGYYLVDADLGEMFLNFPLHDLVKPASGIDLTPYQDALNLPANINAKGTRSKTTWYRWTRNWMGAKASPYFSVQMCYLAEEFARGNNLDKDNQLRWDAIILNLPGCATFDPTKPRVYKWDALSKRQAGDIIIFVDDLRGSGATVEHAWGIVRQVMSRFQYFGVQDATRKRKPPSQSPGAWAGAVFASGSGSIAKTVTKDKWLKGKRIVDGLYDRFFEDELGTLRTTQPQLLYKELEISRGFLGHLSMTFEILVPFLKGFHLVLAEHLGQRDEQGWKMTDKAWKIAQNKIDGLEEFGDSDQPSQTNKQIHHEFSGTGSGKSILSEPKTPMMAPPTHVYPNEQFRNDLVALHSFFELEDPPIIQDRVSTIQIVRYGFGDASGTGFGSTVETKEGIKYRIGVWGKDEEEESSNYKELENVVATVEEEVVSGNLTNSMLFFFTDNSTLEATLHKGNSKSKKLFELVVRFRKIQFKYGTQVVISHISGKRMIEQGTDGVSRGNLKEGVGTGRNMLEFIPLHLSALDRNKDLLPWLQTWMGKDFEVLTPAGWFVRGHDIDGGTRDTRGFWRHNIRSGTFVWAPPPGAAEVALEQLRQALIKRQTSTHVFICPRLLSPEWMRQLHKASDLVVSLPAGIDIVGWPERMLEPLTISFVFPFLKFRPWRRKSTPKMYHLGRTLPGMWKKEGVDAGYILRELFASQCKLGSLPESVVWRLLFFESRS